MTETSRSLKCPQCREEFFGEAIQYRDKLYCCEACAFEASVKSTGVCASRASLAAAERFRRQARRVSL